MAIEYMMGHMDCPAPVLDHGDVEVEEPEKGHAFDEMWGITKRG